MRGLWDKREVGPGAESKKLADGREALRRACRQDAAFGFIDAQAGTSGEVINQRQGRRDRKEGGGGDGEVVGEGIEREGGKTGEGGKEGIVGDNEEQGRERVALLDTASDSNPDVRERPKEGGDGDVVERASYVVKQPTGIASLRDYCLNPIVVNGVEGPRRVEEEEVVGELVLDSREEEVVDISSVRGAVLPPKEALLAGVEEVDRGGHDGVRDDRGEDAIVGVSNTDGPGVGHKVGHFLGDEEEVGEVVARGRGTAVEEELEDREQDGARDVCDGSPGGEGDPIRARRGVLAAGDRVLNIFQGWAMDERGVNTLVVGTEEGRVRRAGRAGLPDTAPEVRGDEGHVGMGSGQGVIRGFLEAFEVLVIVRQGRLDISEGVEALGRAWGWVARDEDVVGSKKAIVSPAAKRERDERAKEGVRPQESVDAR